MSCTENESGPFVVFFLPAVVGCLTILLARRWANSQVNSQLSTRQSTSSTAISRRRKIIKDPLIKRPLPPLTTKMVAAGSKKACGLQKKGSLPVTEDDTNGNGKRVGRVIRLSTAGSPSIGVQDVKPDGPMPPKHIPFPYIPHDGELLFEAMTFIFTVVATGLQFLNLYRTAWWLPHSYTTQAMNFYLIDLHLVAFIVTILSRKLLLSVAMAVLKSILAPKLIPHATMAARMFILGVILGALAWCAYFIYLKHQIGKLFFLCYPSIIYFLLFGFQSSGFLELNNSDTPILHCCSHDPEQMKAEVQMLRQDFNLRMKKILFDSVVGAYYSSFIPCYFAQPFVYYDVYTASQQTALVWGALCGRLCTQLLPAAHCDVPHRAALHLRLWLRHREPESPPEPASRCASLFGRGCPQDNEHKRFLTVFLNPSKILCLFLCMQLSLIVLQLCLLFSSIPWHNFLSIVILLFINYYTLFKMLRDYLIAWKVYKAENMIQDKNNLLQPVNN